MAHPLARSQPVPVHRGAQHLRPRGPRGLRLRRGPHRHGSGRVRPGHPRRLHGELPRPEPQHRLHRHRPDDGACVPVPRRQLEHRTARAAADRVLPRERHRPCGHPDRRRRPDRPDLRDGGGGHRHHGRHLWRALRRRRHARWAHAHDERERRGRPELGAGGHGQRRESGCAVRRHCCAVAGTHPDSQHYPPQAHRLCARCRQHHRGDDERGRGSARSHGVAVQRNGRHARRAHAHHDLQRCGSAAHGDVRTRDEPRQHVGPDQTRSSAPWPLPPRRPRPTSWSSPPA